jgi:predicted nicotinamide N-methyase
MNVAALEIVRSQTRLSAVPLAPEIRGAEVVLVADAFYERDLAARVMRFAERARARGATVLLADPGRAYLPRARLTPLASYDVPGVAAIEDADRKHTTVWAPRW